MSKPLYVVSVDPSSDEDNVPQWRLLYTNKDKKNYLLMDTGASIPIVAWKLTKNGRLPHSGFSQRFKLNADSPSMPEKDIGLLYSLIERLLFTSKITRSDIYMPVYHT